MAVPVSKDQMSHEPDLNRLAALVDGRLTGDERQGVLWHLAECRTCRDVVAVLTDELGPARAATATRWGRPAVWLPVAATLAIAAGAAFLVRTTDRRTLMPPPAPSTVVVHPPPPESAGRASGSLPPSAPALGARGDLRRRGGTRQVGAKTFRLVAGEWIDSTYDPGALLPIVEVASADARRDLLARLPALAPYAAIAERVIVVHEGSVYRFRAAAR
jgi:putative zinc finger protein